MELSKYLVILLITLERARYPLARQFPSLGACFSASRSSTFSVWAWGFCVLFFF
ncbi:MAG: hypothetical protein R3B54_13340 [Bdellovibrionota bacterium]